MGLKKSSPPLFGLALTAILPYYLNDFLFILLSGKFYPTILISTLTEVWAISVLLFAVLSGQISMDQLGLRKASNPILFFGTLSFSILGVLIVHSLGSYLYPCFTGSILFAWVPAPNFLASFLDLTLGIVLVAIGEELLFRGFLISYLEKLGMGRLKLIGVSAVIFSLMHWSLGLHILIISFLWGVLSAAFYCRYRTVLPLIIGHYTGDSFSFYLFYFSS